MEEVYCKISHSSKKLNKYDLIGIFRFEGGEVENDYFIKELGFLKIDKFSELKTKGYIVEIL